MEKNVAIYKMFAAAGIVLALAGYCGVIFAESIVKGTLCIAAGYAVEFLATAVYEIPAVRSGKKEQEKAGN